MGQISCGIDFGTSNSTVGVGSGDGVRLVAVEGKNLNIPSAIFFDFDDQATYFGRSAVQRYVDGAGGRFMRSMKSVLGSSLMEDKTRIGSRNIAFADIIGLFIGHLKSVTESVEQQQLEHVVLGRPVFFVDGDEHADRAAATALETAARGQGFKHVLFQYEPVAAALDYERTCTEEELALVIDVGGGTADFSVVRVSPGGAQKASRESDVLSSHGVHIGGTDFDRSLSLRSAMPRLGYRSQIRGLFDETQLRGIPNHHFVELATWHTINRQYSAKNIADAKALLRVSEEPEKLQKLTYVLEHRRGHGIAMAIEAAKIALTSLPSTVLELPTGAVPDNAMIMREDLVEAVSDMVVRLQQALIETLRLGGVNKSSIRTAFLTGGSTEIPLLRDSLLGLMPGARAINGDKFGSVGTGLAIESVNRFGH